MALDPRVVTPAIDEVGGPLSAQEDQALQRALASMHAPVVIVEGLKEHEKTLALILKVVQAFARM
jgi:hypothetical protein